LSASAALRPGAALLAVALCGATSPASAEPTLQAGTFLYADPTLVGSVFESSVIVLVHVDPRGTTGLIVNKPTKLHAHTLLGVDGAERLRRPLYLGGPVGTEGVSALVRLEAGSPDRVLHVIDDVFYVTDLDAVGRSLREPAPDRRVRVFAGSSGWGPGQLEGEIARGSWVVAKGEVDAIFSDEPETLWEEVYRLMNAIEVRLPRPAAGPARVAGATPSRRDSRGGEPHARRWRSSR
jgi:putative transcriptional regulator